MRRAFVHEASLQLHGAGDLQAPGAAVTVQLCGHWDHAPPCRWPHRATASDCSGPTMNLRVVFVADPADEQEVRARIARGVRSGRLDGPSGVSTWVLSEGPSELQPDEVAIGADLASK